MQTSNIYIDCARVWAYLVLAYIFLQCEFQTDELGAKISHNKRIFHVHKTGFSQGSNIGF